VDRVEELVRDGVTGARNPVGARRRTYRRSFATRSAAFVRFFTSKSGHTGDASDGYRPRDRRPRVAQPIDVLAVEIALHDEPG